MITDAQYERLPAILQEIVDNDQQRAALRAPDVIAFEAAKGYARLQAIRAELRIAAKSLWGHNLNKNAPHAKRTPEHENDIVPR